ncbi:MAG: hypothetical protein H0T44_03455 [Gemmatimonadales bacterium]|nr:hypothetical protein [Gemmatimonadales bacterium]MDQ3427785.1 hypothetical protein [Gemmatimonadota bacterium]
MLTRDAELVNLAFFDAYFSNFIEGTRFEVAEAREIGRLMPTTSSGPSGWWRAVRPWGAAFETFRTSTGS